MEVMDSPLNRAHHYGRKAERLVAREKYEEAILCHDEAAELLKEALATTQTEQAEPRHLMQIHTQVQKVRLSLELQRDRHLQQQRLIKMSCRQAKLKGKPSISFSKHSSALSSPCTVAFTRVASQTVHQCAPRPPLGWKVTKDDKTHLEEQSTVIADLWKLVAVLLTENEQLLEEQEKLKVENARLKREPYEEHQSPLSSLAEPAKMLSTLGMTLVHVPINLQEKIQLLWERATES